jgi:hypothetical protein
MHTAYPKAEIKSPFDLRNIQIKKIENFKEEIERLIITQFLSGGGCETAQVKEWLSILLHFSELAKVMILLMPLTSISMMHTNQVCICKTPL